MEKPEAATRFAAISRFRAALILSLTALAILACLLASHAGKPPTRLNVSGFTDPEVLDRIVDRVRRGQAYYQAAGAELRADGFFVRSVFNWRQPLYAWFLAIFPSPLIGRLLLGALAILMTLLGVRHSLRLGDQLGAVIALWLVPGACYGAFVTWGATTLEISAGVLIALSIFTYADDHWFLGLLLALTALFIRELAAPYVLICIALALVNKRWRELIAWTVGLLFYTAYFAFHVSHVLASVGPTDAPDPSSWIQFGGLHFILTTASQHVLFLATPLWVTALYLPLALLGLIAIPGSLGRRASLTVTIYLIFFAFVGKSFNDYWGFLYSPLLALGFSLAPLAAVHLWKALR